MRLEGPFHDQLYALEQAVHTVDAALLQGYLTTFMPSNEPEQSAQSAGMCRRPTRGYLGAQGGWNSWVAGGCKWLRAVVACSGWFVT